MKKFTFTAYSQGEEIYATDSALAMFWTNDIMLYSRCNDVDDRVEAFNDFQRLSENSLDKTLRAGKSKVREARCRIDDDDVFPTYRFQGMSEKILHKLVDTFGSDVREFRYRIPASDEIPYAFQLWELKPSYKHVENESFEDLILFSPDALSVSVITITEPIAVYCLIQLNKIDNSTGYALILSSEDYIE